MKLGYKKRGSRRFQEFERERRVDQLIIVAVSTADIPESA